MDTFWGVVLGGAIAVLSNFVLHRTQLSRDRGARREVRRHAAQDRQREALNALQEGLEQLQNLRLEQTLRAIEGTMDLNAPFDVLKLRSRIELLIARVTDDEAGKAGRKAANRASVLLGISDLDHLQRASDGLGEARREFRQRAGVLLKELEG